MMYRRLVFRLTVAALVVVSMAGSARAGRVVEQIRYYPHEGFTRVVVDLGEPCPYKVTTHSNPERIAINLTGSRAGRSLRNIGVDTGGVERARVNELSWGTQVVIDLASTATYKAFTLARTGSKPDRIVIDVTPGGGTSGAVAASLPSAPGRSNSPARDDGLFVVAIDPGHGGRDHGTTGRYGLVEKEYTLDIARRIANEVDSYPGFRAVLTRSSDTYLTLPRRVQIAESKGADIFVSIHLNSAPNRSARGAEVFFVSPAGAERIANQMLAHPDRAAHELGIRGAASSDVLQMLVDVNQQAVLTRSEGLAESILVELSKPGLLATRSVKQKSFAVLRNISMPSVLIEAGFISNEVDAKLIRSSAGRDKVARSIGEGIHAYLGANPPPREEGKPVVVHHVKPGDTLWGLSREYGASISSIRRLNRLGASSALRVGQELLIYERY